MYFSSFSPYPLRTKESYAAIYYASGSTQPLESAAKIAFSFKLKTFTHIFIK